MIRTKINNTGNGVYDYHAEVPFLRKPVIQSEKVVNGVRYYFGNGKRYVADLFDRYFKTVKTNIKGKEYKGVIGNYDSSFE